MGRTWPDSTAKGLLGVGGFVGVEDPHDRHAGRGAAFDQGVLRGEVGRGQALGPVRALAERFLGVDHNQTGFHGGAHGGIMAAK
jgi:hypothetical protein